MSKTQKALVSAGLEHLEHGGDYAELGNLDERLKKAEIN
jgi:hypothetical protein